MGEFGKTSLLVALVLALVVCTLHEIMVTPQPAGLSASSVQCLRPPDMFSAIRKRC